MSPVGGLGAPCVHRWVRHSPRGMWVVPSDQCNPHGKWERRQKSSVSLLIVCLLCLLRTEDGTFIKGLRTA